MKLKSIGILIESGLMLQVSLLSACACIHIRSKEYSILKRNIPKKNKYEKAFTNSRVNVDLPIIAASTISMCMYLCCNLHTHTAAHKHLTVLCVLY